DDLEFAPLRHRSLPLPSGQPNCTIEPRDDKWRIRHTFTSQPPLENRKMNLKLTGKSVLVTGASKGIGRAIAAAFATEGAQVAMTARGGEELTRAAEEIRKAGGNVFAIAGDVTKEADLKRMVDETVAR